MSKWKEGMMWFFKSFLWLIPVLIGVDQGTKLWAYYGNANITVIPNFFRIVLTWNTGAAWSMFEEHPALLAVVSIVACAGLSTYLGLKWKKLAKGYRLSLILMIAGCAGNLIDRVMQVFPNNLHSGKGVIDFLSFRLFGVYDFPCFNVADMCLVIGVFLLILWMILDEIKEKKENNEKVSSDQ